MFTHAVKHTYYTMCGLSRNDVQRTVSWAGGKYDEIDCKMCMAKIIEMYDDGMNQFQLATAKAMDRLHDMT